MKVVLSGGGTGGHITPIKALADALRAHNPRISLTYIGEGSALENKILGQDIARVKIPSGKFRRYHDETFWRRITDVKTNILNIRDAVRFLRGLLRAWRTLGKIRPDVVFVKGGYVGLPVGIAAHWRRIPLVIHESDARPGLANSWLSKYARIIATGFPSDVYRSWQGKPVAYIGNLVRSEILGMPVSRARKQLGLRSNQRMLLIMGGSTGAAAINRAVQTNLAALCKRYEVFHITGKGKGNVLHEQPKSYHQFDYVDSDFNILLAAADCIVSRSGMNSVTEVAAYKKPLVLIPGPQLSDQGVNAKALVDAKAAVLLNQEDIDTQLSSVIEQIFSSKVKREELSSNIAKFYRPQAARELANIIIQSANG